MKKYNTKYPKLKKRHIFIPICVVIIILLIVLFLWEEHYDYSKMIDAEKFASFFTILSSLGTLISLYFLFNQLSEMKEGRIAASQPDLFPASAKFEVSEESNNFPDKQVLNSKEPQIKVSSISDENTVSDNAYIEIFNIGQGAAKYINLQWKYDLGEIERLIGIQYRYHKLKEAECKKIDFVRADNKFKIPIPCFYFNCCGSRLNQSLEGVLGSEVPKPKPKPKISLIIDYHDIQNNSYTK